MEECIFCKIVAGKIPCYKVYEDDLFLGFLDITPKSVGHCLLIPKKHYRWVYDVDNFSHFFDIAQKLIKHQLTINQADYMSILTMGNDISHAHIHLIPYYSKTPILSKLSLKEIAAKINL